MIKKFKKILIPLYLSMIGSIAQAEPTSSATLLTYVRPYGSGDIVFLGANIPNGSFCSQSFYSINISSNAGKAMYAAALVAVAQKKYVYLEINYCGTGDSGSNVLNSLYLLP